MKGCLIDYSENSSARDLAVQNWLVLFGSSDRHLASTRTAKYLKYLKLNEAELLCSPKVIKGINILVMRTEWEN